MNESRVKGLENFMKDKGVMEGSIAVHEHPTIEGSKIVLWQWLTGNKPTAIVSFFNRDYFNIHDKKEKEIEKTKAHAFCYSGLSAAITFSTEEELEAIENFIKENHKVVKYALENADERWHTFMDAGIFKVLENEKPDLLAKDTDAFPIQNIENYKSN